MALEVNFDQARTVTKVPAVTATLSSLNILRMEDSPEQQHVKVYIAEIQDPVILWAGATAYSTCGANNDGQWTDADVVSAIKAIYDVA